MPKLLLSLVMSLILIGTAVAETAGMANKCSAVYSQSVLEIFARENSEHYQCGICGDNIYFFLRQIAKLSPQTDLAHSKVLIIYARAYDATKGYIRQTFSPLRTREYGPDPLWRFHVVLLHEGQIYDFDHNADAHPVPYRQYFQDMFDVRARTKSNWLSKLRDRILIQLVQAYYGVFVIPASEYLKDHHPEQNLRGFPVEGNKSAEAWLRSYAPQGKNLEDYINEIEISDNSAR